MSQLYGIGVEWQDGNRLHSGSYVRILFGNSAGTHAFLPRQHRGYRNPRGALFCMIPEVSVVIPAFNEEERIGPTLDAVHAYFSYQSYRYEILVVDDGSDDHTAEVVSERMDRISGLSLIGLPRNQGKGAAVKAGMLAARGTARLLMDADNSTAIEHLDRLLPELKNGFDVVIGSRRVPGARIAIPQSFFRELSGSIFRAIVHQMLPISVADTQNGFKLFSAEAADAIFHAAQMTGWAFDVEILLLAERLGFRVGEVPITWHNDGRSKVRPHHMAHMLFDVFRLRRRFVSPGT